MSVFSSSEAEFHINYEFCGEHSKLSTLHINVKPYCEFADTQQKIFVYGKSDRLCGLVVRVLGYRSGGPGSIPGTTKKKK
jgi:hypothetical protein